MTLVTALMGGKGWGRNNVFNLEKILRWEKEKGNELSLSERVMTNEVKPNCAIDFTGKKSNRSSTGLRT